MRFDTKTCYLERPFNEIIQKMARLASLTADTSAPTELLSEQKAKLAVHFKVIKLCQRNKALTERLRVAEYKAVKNTQETSLFKQKKRADTRLNTAKKRLRVDIIAQARKRHFRKTDIIAFDAQFSVKTTSHAFALDTLHAKPFTYNISERAEIVRSVCSSEENFTDKQKFQRRIKTIEIRTALCHRQKVQCCGRPKITIKQEKSDKTVNGICRNTKDKFRIECLSIQCLFCLENESLLYYYRTYEYSKPHQIINEIEKHLERFAPEDKIRCPHPQCKTTDLVLPSIGVFKNHTARIYKILLRA